MRFFKDSCPNGPVSGQKLQNPFKRGMRGVCAEYARTMGTGGVQGFARIYKDLQGSVMIYKDLHGFVRICNDSQGFERIGGSVRFS